MTEINYKDQQYRIRALEGNMIKALFALCYPLALFQFFSQIFSILDTLMASHISSKAVSVVSYMVQMNHLMAAIGGGLATSMGIIISQNYGEGRYDELKKNLSTILSISFFFSILMLVLSPFTNVLLKILNTPSIFIEEGSLYFSVILIGMAFNFFNMIYIAIERARGNSKRILTLNMIVIITKLVLSAIFVYIFDFGITMIAFATLLSYLLLFTLAFKRCFIKNDAFTFSFKAIRYDKKTLRSIFRLAIPSMLEKMAFSYGKALVNQMSAGYGTTVVGAAGISNNMSGLLTGLQNGFQDGGAALISQNMGGGKKERAEKLFIRLLIIEVIIGFIGILIYMVIALPISRIFAHWKGGYSPEFQMQILTIFRYELIGCLCLSFAYASIGFLLGLGKPKLTLLINFMRIFVFRIPVIYYLSNHTDLKTEAVGITMMISNTLTGLFALSVALICYLKLKKERKASI